MGSMNASNFRDIPRAIPIGKATTRDKRKPKKILEELAKISPNKFPLISKSAIADNTLLGGGRKNAGTNPVYVSNDQTERKTSNPADPKSIYLFLLIFLSNFIYRD